MAEEFAGFENNVIPLKKPNPDDYPGGSKPIDKPFNPKEDIPESFTKPGAIPLPLPGAGQPPLSSTEDIKAAVRNMRSESRNAPIDPWVKAKTQKFNAGMDGLNYERYYNHPKYNKLGFTPFRDNETLYNEESNFLHDMGRAMTQWPKVAGLGFKDAAGFGSLTDIGTAKDYEKYMAIGSTSKEGAGAFATNLYMNTGYTIGIMAEVVLEELGLAAITYATAGGAAPVTGSVAVARGISGVNKIRKSYSVGKNLLRTLENLKDMNKARKYFGEAVTGTAEFLNPMQESLEFMQGVSKTKNLSSLAKTTQGFAAFYKDIRNIRLAWGEAGLEGGMVANTLSDELLNEHLEKFGRAPTKEEADEIYEISMQAGMSTGWQNLGAIFYSNKIVFDNLFKGFKPLSTLADDGLDFGAAGKIIQNKKLRKSPYIHVEKNMKTMLDAAKDPVTYGRTVLGYFKANLAEGLQESVQEVISGATSDVYREEWRGTPLKGGYLAAVADNLQKQMTPQGLEVFMSGFLMGGLIQPVTRAPGYLRQKFDQFRDSDSYRKQKEARKEYINTTVTQLNDLYNNVDTQLEPNLDNLVRQAKIQKGMAEASAKGDAKEFHDLKDESHFDNVETALRTGRMDSLYERLEELKGFTPEEIQKEFDMDQAAFVKKIDDTIANTKRIEARYEVAQKEMTNPFNPSQYKHGSEEWFAETANKAGWDDMVKQFLFLQNSFDRNIARKTGIIEEVQTDTQLANIAMSEFTPLYDTADMDSEVKRLNVEIDFLKGATGDILKDRKKKEEKRDLLKDFADAMSNVKTSGKGNFNLKNKETKVAVKKAKKAYNAYMKHLAKANKDYVFDDALDRSFQKLLDYHKLDKETPELNNAVNTMLDPGFFTRAVKNVAKLKEQRHQMRQQELRESLEAYIKVIETNRLMELLYDDKDAAGNPRRRMFFDPEELDALLKDGKPPTNFYYANGGVNDEIEQVPRNSPDFRAAIAIVLEYVPNLMDIPISEENANAARNQYASKARLKDEDDKRTYDDLATQFGFDPKAEKTEVSLVDVLDAIIESDYATKEEKLLAKELKKKASAGEVINFVNNLGQPGEYSTTTQTTIDARYNASNFKNGGLPIEHVILHEEIHRRTVAELEIDPQFNKEIDNLYQISLTHFNANKAKDETRPYGLASIQEFVAEAMTNQNFQSFLADIPFESTGVPVWNKFVDVVLKLLKKVFGKTASNSVLNEAMYLITTKVDAAFVTKESAEKTPIPQAGKGTPTVSTPAGPERSLDNTKVAQNVAIIDLLDAHKPLAENLLVAYKAANAALKADTTKVMLDPEYIDKTDDEIYNSVQFKRYIGQAANAKVKAIFDEYNANRPYEPLLQASDGKKNTAIRKRLEEKGYSSAEINDMTVGEAVALANSLLDKAGQAAAEVQSAEEEDIVKAKLKVKVRKEVEERFAGVNTLDELILAREATTAQLQERQDPNAPMLWDIAEYTAQELQAIYDAREAELARDFSWDDIVENSVIKMVSGEEMFVVKKTANKITGHKLGDITKKRSVAKSKLKERVRMVLTAAARGVTGAALTDELTPADQEISAENNNKIDNTEDSVNDDWDNDEGGDDANPGCP